GRGRHGGVCDGLAGPRMDQGNLAVGADDATVVPLPAAGADKLVWHFERMMLPNPPTVPFRHSGVTRHRRCAERRGAPPPIETGVPTQPAASARSAPARSRAELGGEQRVASPPLRGALAPIETGGAT